MDRRPGPIAGPATLSFVLILDFIGDGEHDARDGIDFGANMTSASDEVQRQREYYQRTAAEYEIAHVSDDDEHTLALAFMAGAIDWLGLRSVLDVGSGTGRAIHYLKKRCPTVRVVGIEPVQALREIGHSQGLSEKELIEGDATRLNVADGSFDLVCEFGVLHHLRDPSIAVREMLRAASRSIFISDSNNFGQGSSPVRSLKQALRTIGLWPLAKYLKFGGKGYTESEGDGIAYPYSVFDSYPLVAEHCRRIHVLNTNGDGRSAFRSAAHVALLGVK